MMKEYKFLYEAAPISEVLKLRYIKATNIINALSMFFASIDIKVEVISVQLVERE